MVALNRCPYRAPSARSALHQLTDRQQHHSVHRGGQDAGQVYARNQFLPQKRLGQVTANEPANHVCDLVDDQTAAEINQENHLGYGEFTVTDSVFTVVPPNSELTDSE